MIDDSPHRQSPTNLSPMSTSEEGYSNENTPSSSPSSKDPEQEIVSVTQEGQQDNSNKLHIESEPATSILMDDNKEKSRSQTATPIPKDTEDSKQKGISPSGNTNMNNNSVGRLSVSTYHDYPPTIHHSPGVNHYNLLQHSVLTPIIRNTNSGDNQDADNNMNDGENKTFVVSPDDHNIKEDSDYFSTLAMPDSNEDRSNNNNEKSEFIAFKPSKSPYQQPLGTHNTSQRKLPSEIYLSADNDFAIDSTSPITPQTYTIDKNGNRTAPRPSPSTVRSQSVGNLDSYSVLMTDMMNNSNHHHRHVEPIPEAPYSPNESSEGSGHNGDEMVNLNNVSAPPEFFENTFLNSTIPLESSRNKRSFESPKQYLRKSLSGSERNYRRTFSSASGSRPSLPSSRLPPLASVGGSGSQYQPGNRDTDVGVNVHAEGVKSIFTARRSYLRNNSGSSPAWHKPISMTERQSSTSSFASLHLANQLVGDSSTATYTNESYSWEEDDSFARYDDDVGYDENFLSSKIATLVLPERNEVPLGSEEASDIAVGSMASESVLTSSIRSDSALFNTSFTTAAAQEEPDEQIVMELDQNLDPQRNKSSRKRQGRDAMEWLQELQCGSENKVGEAASSKFLTKGFSHQSHGSPVRRSEQEPLKIVPQSVDRGALRRRGTISNP